MTSQPVDPSAARLAYLVVVKRGDTDRFDRVRKVFAGDDVDVIWDRRSGLDRRQACGMIGHDRRAVDRRDSPPSSWANLGFLLTPRKG